MNFQNDPLATVYQPIFENIEKQSRHNIFELSPEQKKFLDKYVDDDWIVNTELSMYHQRPWVIARKDVHCNFENLNNLEGSPDEVYGRFFCHNSKLRSLKGASTTVWGDFDCSSNKLVSLEGAPKTIKGDFICNNNELTSLKGMECHVKGRFFCYFNALKSLSDLSILIGKVDRGVYSDLGEFDDMEELKEVLRKHKELEDSLDSTKDDPENGMDLRGF